MLSQKAEAAVKTANEDMPGALAPSDALPADEEDESPIELDTVEAARPAGEAGLFGDPRRDEDIDDGDDQDPEAGSPQAPSCLTCGG